MSARLALAALASALVLLAAGTAREGRAATSGAGLRAETFFRCATGYSFAVNGNAAHCKKAGTTTNYPMENCPNVGGVGLFAAVDRVGTKDMCSGTNPITGEVSVERACPAGTVKRIVAGGDRCERTTPPQYVAPSVAVSL